MRTEDTTAWVSTKRNSSCEGCASRGSCNATGNQKEMEVQAINAAGARPGDRVVIRFESGSLLKASFLLYVFPILAMLFGAIVGQQGAPYMGMEASSGSVLLAFASFFIALVIVRSTGNRLARRTEYRPKVTRIL